MDIVLMIFGVVLVTALFLVSYRVGYIRGYRAGANVILYQWKQTLNLMGDEDDVR